MNYLAVLFLAFVSAVQESTCAFLEDPRDTTCTPRNNFIIQCRTPPGAISSRWVYNNSRVYITQPPEGLYPTSRNDLFKMNLTCVPARHYTTIQCVAIQSIHGPHITEAPSRIATIKVEGMPERIRNLRNTSYPSVIQLTWDEVEPNITYCVSVRRDSHVLMESCRLLPNFSLPRGNVSVSDTEDTLYEFAVSATNRNGTGPSTTIVTNFNFGLPDTVKNISSHPLPNAALITWDSLGPNITYCFEVLNCTLGEVCGLIEPRYVVNGALCFETMTRKVRVIAVSRVGRGLPIDNVLNLTRLPDTVRAVRFQPMACGALITWDSLGPSITYCIDIVNSTIEEVCGLEEPRYILNVSRPEVRTWYRVTLTAESHVGRGLPSENLQVEVLPLPVTTTLVSSTQQTDAKRINATLVLNLSKEIVIVIIVSLSAIITLVILASVLMTIYFCCKFSQHRRVLRSVVSIDMLACDAYVSSKTLQGTNKKFEMVDDKGCDRHYDIITTAADPDPLYAHIT